MEIDGSQARCVTNRSKESELCLRLQVTDLIRNNDGSFELACIKQNSTTQTQSTTTNSTQSSGIGSAHQANDTIRLIVQGVWRQNELAKDCTIHLINPLFDQETGKYVIDNDNGLMIIEPDKMYTCTLIASSLFCERKTWLNNIFLGRVGSNRAMLIGTLTHECFQYGVKNRISDTKRLIEFLDEQLDDATIMLEIYSAEATLKDVRDEVIRYISSVKQWIENYMLTGPMEPLTNAPELEVKVTKVVDIEENVWSTKYGLKGKIDVTGLVKIHDKRNKTIEEKTIPLELKTGNPNLSSSHAAQVSLYSMMIEDRYARTNQGFVIYLKEKAAMHNVVLTNNTKRDLIQRRNVLNHFMKDYSIGPEMLNQTRVCGNCERLTECILMSDIYTPGQIESEYSIMRGLKPEATGHLEKKVINFFKRYHEKLVHLITKPGVPFGGENSESSNLDQGQFWTRSSDESESNGTGFGKLQASKSKDDPKIIIFKRHPKHEGNFNIKKVIHTVPQLVKKPEPVKPAKKKLKIEDYFKAKPVQPKCVDIIDIGDDDDDLGDFNGPADVQLDMKVLKPLRTDIVYERTRFAISVDHGDDQTMDSTNSSTAIAIGFINELNKTSFQMKLFEGSLERKHMENLMFRVDKIEKRTNHDLERVALIRLLENTAKLSLQANSNLDNTDKILNSKTTTNGTSKPAQSSNGNQCKQQQPIIDNCDNIRRLLTDPEYKSSDDMDLNVYILSNCYDEFSSFDAIQQKFIIGALSTCNYYILNERIEPDRTKINPMLGCIVNILRNHLNKSVVIVAQQLDSLLDLMRLLRRKKLTFALIDDGSSNKARYEFSADLIKVPRGSGIPVEKKFEMYVKAHETAPIVFSTYAMSLGGLQFSRRQFDYCIATESHQVELLLGLGPLFVSNKHILVDIATGSQPDQQPVNGTNKRMTLESQLNVSLGQHLRWIQSDDAAAL